MQPLRRLLVYGPLMPDLARGLAAGVEAYGSWDICIRGLDTPPGKDLKGLGVDAVLAYVSTVNCAAVYKNFTGPVLNYSGVLGASVLPRLSWDNVAAGRLAAEHFLQRGYTNFVYVAYDGAQFSNDRQQGFVAALAEHAFGCALRTAGPFALPAKQATPQGMYRWFERWSRPLAVFAANDHVARRLAEAALAVGWSVPEDLAILGCDDSPDALLAPVTISTIVPPLFDMGVHAIRLLSSALAGDSLPQDVRLAPTDIISRASTAVAAIVDDRVAAAVSWIRRNLQRRIAVDDVADAIAVSRRALELAFSHSHPRSPKGEIEFQRIALAKRLLSNPDMSLAAIANRCGFRDRQRFSVVFKRLTGQTPGTYKDTGHACSNHD